MAAAPDNIRAVVVDLDGTLVDSLPDIADALNAGLASQGLAPIDSNRVRGMVGGGVRLLVERAFAALGPEYADPELFKRVLAAAFAHYRAHPCDKTVLFPHAREALAALRSEGIKMASAPTSRPTLRKQFWSSSPCGTCSTASSTPAGLYHRSLTGHAQRLLAELNLAPAEAVMVGDSGADVGAGRGAGCRCVLMSFGYTQKPAAELGGDLVLDSFAELPAAPFQTRLILRRSRAAPIVGDELSPIHRPGTSMRGLRLRFAALAGLWLAVGIVSQAIGAPPDANKVERELEKYRGMLGSEKTRCPIRDT